MAIPEHIAALFGNTLQKLRLAELPTPVDVFELGSRAGSIPVFVKRDDLSSGVYGGNKVRKLEYLLARAASRRRYLIATFGTVGSHHALATAIFARRCGYPCTCFLAHQAMSPGIRSTLEAHLAIGTRIVRYGGGYAARLQTLREHLRGERVSVVPAGGSSWLGTVGFVEAGVELARQVAAGTLPEPGRVYVATGTMGTAAGLALGIALCGLRTRVHAVRVSHSHICNGRALRRLLGKTAAMLARAEPGLDENIASRAGIVLRDEFFADGYARSDARTDAALVTARDELGLELETTYTAKAMAALLSDLATERPRDAPWLFWNSYNSAPLPAGPARVELPQEFRRYLA